MSESNDLIVECVKPNSVGLWRVWKGPKIILYILMEDSELTFLTETKME